MEEISIIVKVFCFGFLIDFLWVFYILFVTKKLYLMASGASMAMAAPALFGYFEMYEVRWLTVPYLFGLGFGTYVGLRTHGYLEKKSVIQRKSD